MATSVDLPYIHTYQRAVPSSPLCDLIVIYNIGQSAIRRPVRSVFQYLPSLPCVCRRWWTRGPVWVGARGRALELQPAGATEPTRRFRPSLAHSLRFIIAWAQYKPIRGSVC